MRTEIEFWEMEPEDVYEEFNRASRTHAGPSGGKVRATTKSIRTIVRAVRLLPLGVSSF
jgi:hypothetical protein